MIRDVKIFDIKSNVDKREVFRADKINTKIQIKQIRHSFIKKSVIKAWHIHKDKGNGKNSRYRHTKE